MYKSKFFKENKETIKEDYGWEVKRGREWDLLDELIDAFGEENILDAITRAMGTDELSETLAFICRNYDFRSRNLK